MSYCPKCGKQILDESMGCPFCSVKDNVDYSKSAQEINRQEIQQDEPEAEVVTDFTVEDANSQRFESRVESGDNAGGTSYGQGNAALQQEQTIPTVLKILIILGILLVGGIGAIAGLIAGAALLKSPYEDYRKFGKTMVVLGIVMLVLWLLCCCIVGLTGGITGSIMEMEPIITDEIIFEF